MGDLQGAEHFVRAALRHDPRFAFAHYKLAELLGGKLPPQDLAAQRRLLEQGAGSREQGAHDRHATVVPALRSRPSPGCAGRVRRGRPAPCRGQRPATGRLAQRGKEYDPTAHESLISRTKAICGPEFFQWVRDFGSESELPVFVVGLPRSGTTLVEQILAGHPQVYGAGEIKLAHDTMAALGGQGADPVKGLRQLDRETVRRLAAQHLERLRELDRTALRIVDKMPDNYMFLGLLACLFPRAKLIHCRRDLRDTAVSCWMTQFQEVRWANDQRHIVSRFHEYQRIMAHWREVLPVPLLEIDYEETVTDLEAVARRLVGWCGLEWEPACLEFQQVKRPVSTASLVQVRQPIFTTSVGRWKHYEPFLAGLLDALPGGA